MRPGEDHFRLLERLYAEAPVTRWQGSRLEVAEARATVVLPFRGEFLHAAHAVHGSLIFRALDDAAFFAANSLVPDVFVLTASFDVHFLRPVPEGDLVAEGRVLDASRRRILASSEVKRADGKVAARGTGTFMPSRHPLDPSGG